MILGDEDNEPDANCIYWVNQLVTGAEVSLVFIVAVIRVGLFIAFKQLF